MDEIMCDVSLNMEGFGPSVTPKSDSSCRINGCIIRIKYCRLHNESSSFFEIACGDLLGFRTCRFRGILQVENEFNQKRSKQVMIENPFSEEILCV